MLIAFAVSFLIAWTADDWWLLIPVLMLAAGAFYIVLGAFLRLSETGVKARRRSAPYNVFWGGTLVVLGAIWLVNRDYPGNGPLLFALFIIWIGVVAVVLSLPRLMKKADA